MEKAERSESNISKLKSQLENAGIDISIWGTGGYKTINHLVNEIECQEVSLDVDENGELLRISEVVAAKVFYAHNDGKTYRLKEERQVFLDGRERVRPSAGQSVFEKMKLGENPEEAIVRGIAEELGVGKILQLNYIEKVENIADSKSYPGLLTKSTTHFFEVELTAEQFKSQGYIEEQADKITFFVWEQIG